MSPNVIDLTQIMDEGMPTWDGCCGFKMEAVLDYSDGLRVQALSTPNGIGTHIDAPCHFIKGGMDIASIGLEQLICPGVVIDVSSKADQHYALSCDDVLAFETQHGPIPENTVVVIHTGWGKRWSTPDLYRNENTQGVMRFPTVSVEASDLLLDRKINAIAIDTLSPDKPDSRFPVHQKLLGAGKFIIENIMVADELPTVGFTLIALPIKIKNATEAPCRVVAFYQR